jgi:hypothetical protein
MMVILEFETGRELRAEVSLSEELPKHMMSISSELNQFEVAGLD